MFATTATASAPMQPTNHHPNARRLSSSTLINDISANNSSLRCVASTCASQTAATTAGT
jgi:hypothetical protein